MWLSEDVLLFGFLVWSSVSSAAPENRLLHGCSCSLLQHLVSPSGPGETFTPALDPSPSPVNITALINSVKVLIWGLSFAFEHKWNVNEQINYDFIVYVKKKWCLTLNALSLIYNSYKKVFLIISARSADFPSLNTCLHTPLWVARRMQKQTLALRKSCEKVPLHHLQALYKQPSGRVLVCNFAPDTGFIPEHRRHCQKMQRKLL